MSLPYRFEVTSRSAPVVELDSSAKAAYVRFSKAKIAKTQLISCAKSVITADLAKDGSLIGLELIGVDEYTLGSLLRSAGVTAAKELIGKARYLPAKSLATVMAV